MYFHVKQIFPNLSQYNFLNKIGQFHEETDHRIYVSVKKNPFFYTRSTFLENMNENLGLYHKQLVQKYLSPNVYKVARETYRRSLYHQTKLQIEFLKNAIQQIREYDEFYLSMEDIHEMDSVMTSLLYKKLYYME